MQTQIKKWGNSLALRIPSHLARELNVEDNSMVEITREGEKLVIEPTKKRPKYRLEDLLSKVTSKNLHPETETGPSVGDEKW